MNFTKPVNEDEFSFHYDTSPKTEQWTPPKRKIRWGRGILWTFIILLLLVIGFVLLIPTLLSTDLAREKILTMVNEKQKAKLEVGDWSLAWFGTQSLSNVTYDDPASGLNVAVNKVTASSLWSLLPIGTMSAELTVDTPVVHINAPQKEVITETAEVVTRLEEEVQPDTFALPTWDLSAKLSVRNASLRSYKFEEAIVQRGNFNLEMDSLQSDIRAQITAQVFDVDFTAGTTLAPIERLLVAKTPAAFLRQATLTLNAPWGSCSTTAVSHQGYAYPETKIETSIDLPKFVNRLRTFGFPLDGLAMHSGSLVANVNLAKNIKDKNFDFEMTCATRNVHALYQNDLLQLNTELNIAAKIHQENLLATEITNLSIQGPGLTASGKGNVENGSLKAEIDVRSLCNALAVFTGPLTIAEPLLVILNAEATQSNGSLKIDAVSNGATVANLTLAAKGVNIEQQNIHSITADLKAYLQPIVEILGVENLQVKGGCFSTTLNGAMAAGVVNSKMEMGLHNVLIYTPTVKIEEYEFMKGSCDIAYDKVNGIQVNNLTLGSYWYSLKGALRYQLGKPLSQALTADLSGTFQPAPPLMWIQHKPGEAYSHAFGMLNYTLKATPLQTKGSLPLINFAVTSEELQVMLPNQPTIKTPLNFSCSLQSDAQNAIHLNSFALLTPYFNINETKGLYATDGQLTLNGSLEVDFDNLWVHDFFDNCRKAGIEVSGFSKQPFSFSAPLQHGALGILNYGTADATVTFDKITVPTLDIPKGSANIKLDKGCATLNLRAEVNGGQLYLNPSVNLTTTPYEVRFPDNAHVLQKVNLTQQMLDEGLKFVNPFLSGAASPTGAIDLYFVNFWLPLSENPIKDLSTVVNIKTSGVTIAPNEMTQSLNAALIRSFTAAIDIQPTIEVNDQDIRVEIKDGKLTASQIALRMHDTMLYCNGTTDLTTQAINFKLSLPLTRELVGGSVYEHIRANEALELPIDGTVNAPNLRVDQLKQSVTQIMMRAASEKATQHFNKQNSAAQKNTSRVVNVLDSFFSSDKDDDEFVSDDTIDSAIDGGLDALKEHIKRKQEKELANDPDSADKHDIINNVIFNVLDGINSDDDDNSKSNNNSDNSNSLDSLLRGFLK